MYITTDYPHELSNSMSVVKIELTIPTNCGSLLQKVYNNYFDKLITGNVPTDKEILTKFVEIFDSSDTINNNIVNTCIVCTEFPKIEDIKENAVYIIDNTPYSYIDSKWIDLENGENIEVSTEPKEEYVLSLENITWDTESNTVEPTKKKHNRSRRPILPVLDLSKPESSGEKYKKIEHIMAKLANTREDKNVNSTGLPNEKDNLSIYDSIYIYQDSYYAFKFSDPIEIKNDRLAGDWVNCGSDREEAKSIVISNCILIEVLKDKYPIKTIEFSNLLSLYKLKKEDIDPCCIYRYRYTYFNGYCYHVMRNPDIAYDRNDICSENELILQTEDCNLAEMWVIVNLLKNDKYEESEEDNILSLDINTEITW